MVKPGVLVLNFGGPRGPDELVPFLKNLFDDVLPGPRFVKALAAPALAMSRARTVRPNYELIGWSPVVATSEAQAAGIRERLGDVPVATGMLFTAPTVTEGVNALREAHADAIVAIALFPQFSLSTTGAAFDRVSDAAGKLPVHYVPFWHDAPGYIKAVGRTIKDAAAKLPGDGPIQLLFSPHGLPLSYVQRGDPYPDHVRETVRLTVEAIGWTDPVAIGWQSRVGPMKWLEPSTLSEVDRIAREGHKRLLIVPVAFVGEHIETLHELDIEVTDHAHKAGITHVGRARAVGTDPDFLDALADCARKAIARFEVASCVKCRSETPKYAGKPKCPSCAFETPKFARTR